MRAQTDTMTRPADSPSRRDSLLSSEECGWLLTSSCQLLQGLPESLIHGQTFTWALSQRMIKSHVNSFPLRVIFVPELPPGLAETFFVLHGSHTPFSCHRCYPPGKYFLSVWFPANSMGTAGTRNNLRRQAVRWGVGTVTHSSAGNVDPILTA